jgi:hypothetical protein
VTGWSLVYEGFDPAQERLHCCAPSIRVAVNGKTSDLAASEHRRFPLR